MNNSRTKCINDRIVPRKTKCMAHGTSITNSKLGVVVSVAGYLNRTVS